MPHYFLHPQLGGIIGCKVDESLAQFRGLPYARIPRRFARSVRLDNLSSAQTPGQNDSCFDATNFGPCSIQPLDSIETDIRWNQLPPSRRRDQYQSEDCLRISITCPVIDGELISAGLPVMVFLHGGALMIGSGDRAYYNPAALCKDALKNSKPVIFISVNYRLGALGFLHCPGAADLLPPNNGLLDQVLAFEWIKSYISGFGGNSDNITAIGQSAGAASLSLHSSQLRDKPLYEKAIVLSGSTTVLVTMTPEEHQSEFLYQAEKLGIGIHGRSMAEVANDMTEVSIDAIRGLNYCEAPCSPSALIPEVDWATMRNARHMTPNPWLKSQILSCSTFDGSISYLVAKGQERKQLGLVFVAVCRAKLKYPQSLLDLYDISERDDDDMALRKICQIVTDIGFHGAVMSNLLGAARSTETRNYRVIFDIGNPFPGLLEKGRFATHTWDVISLFGAYDNLLDDADRVGISEWRRIVLDYCYTGELHCGSWQPDAQTALLVSKDGVECLDHTTLNNSKAQRLLQLAEQECGERGFDVLWEDVVRFFLKTGNPRYGHEADEIVGKYTQDSRNGL